MNIIFNMCIFAYLCIFFIVQQSISMNFKVFLLIFALPIFLSKYPPIFLSKYPPIFLSKYPPIFSDISDISVKSKYRYIRNYRYFVPCVRDSDFYLYDLNGIYVIDPNGALMSVNCMLQQLYPYMHAYLSNYLVISRQSVLLCLLNNHSGIRKRYFIYMNNY